MLFRSFPVTIRAKLRIKLIQEELDELQEAVEQDDIIEAADALADLQYVLAGAILEFGLGSKFADIFDEVQRSNMSKACLNQEVAAETRRYYDAVEKVETFVEEKDGLFIVKRKSDDKILKSVNYSEASLGNIIFNEEERPDYQNRVIEEKAELDEKIKNLQIFLKSEGVVRGILISPEEFGRMMYQVAAMENYSNVLKDRIQNFS